VESMMGATQRASEAQNAFEELSKRKHNFNVE